jgi:hypothetical protein
MNVSDLINLLNQEDPNMKIVVDGYEGGYDELTKIKKICISPNPDNVWWLGKYEECIPAEGEEFAVLLPRK